MERTCVRRPVERVSLPSRDTPADPRVLPGRFGSQGYAYYVLSVCFTISAFGIVDRFLFGLMIEPIKAEFGLSDTVMGLLAGFALLGRRPRANAPSEEPSAGLPQASAVAVVDEIASPVQEP